MTQLRVVSDKDPQDPGEDYLRKVSQQRVRKAVWRRRQQIAVSWGIPLLLGLGVAFAASALSALLGSPRAVPANPPTKQLPSIARHPSRPRIIPPVQRSTGARPVPTSAPAGPPSTGRVPRKPVAPIPRVVPRSAKPSQQTQAATPTPTVTSSPSPTPLLDSVPLPTLPVIAGGSPTPTDPVSPSPTPTDTPTPPAMPAGWNPSLPLGWPPPGLTPADTASDTPSPSDPPTP